MKRSMVLFVLILLCAPSSSAQSRPKRSKPSPSTKQVTDIRQIDFKNFTYRISEFGSGEMVSERLHNGKSSDGSVYINYTAYGDVTGDGSDEAVIVLVVGAVGGNAYYQVGFIYTLKEGRPTVLTEFEGGGKASGDNILGVKVENGLLILDREATLSNEDPCCPEHQRSISYRWNGSRLVEVGRSSVRRKS